MSCCLLFFSIAPPKTHHKPPSKPSPEAFGFSHQRRRHRQWPRAASGNGQGQGFALLHFINARHYGCLREQNKMASHGGENGQEQENGQMVGKGTSKEMPFFFFLLQLTSSVRWAMKTPTKTSRASCKSVMTLIQIQQSFFSRSLFLTLTLMNAFCLFRVARRLSDIYPQLGTKNPPQAIMSEPLPSPKSPKCASLSRFDRRSSQ